LAVASIGSRQSAGARLTGSRGPPRRVVVGGDERRVVEVGAEAGVGTFYRHFPRREDLVAALVALRFRELASGADREAADPQGALVRWLAELVTVSAAYRDAADVIMELVDAVEDDPLLRALRPPSTNVTSGSVRPATSSAVNVNQSCPMPGRAPARGRPPVRRPPGRRRRGRRRDGYAAGLDEAFLVGGVAAVLSGCLRS
jgi:AcrR family transcriptional regulator